VRTVISCPRALICDECIELCVEILEDEIGPDWRSETPS
jgi:ATP-dependent protease Clp ATPase subunit